MKQLILLHGWAADRRIWNQQYPLEQGQIRLWTPDLAQWQADWLMTYLQQVEPAQTILVGWSLGGMLALEACARGFRPRALVLIAACASFCRRPDFALGWPAAVVRGMRQRLKAQPDQVVQDFYRRLLAPGEQDWQEPLAALLPRSQDPLWLATGLAYLQHADLRPQLGQVAAGQILIVHGAADRITEAAQAYFLQEELPGSRLLMLPDTGHAPMVSRSQAVNGLLAALLAD